MENDLESRIEDKFKEIRIEIKEVEKDVDETKKDVVILERRVTDVETQLGRITSHIESEIGLARRDVSKASDRNAEDLQKISKQLFGDGSDVYGGRIGQLTKGQHKFEKRIAWIGGISIAIFTLFEILMRVLPYIKDLRK